MTREQLAHVLRTVARISGERDILIIGSQSILGSYPEDQLPARATGSMEVDTAFFADPDGVKADVVDVNLDERVGTLPAHPAIIDRVRNWIDAMRARYRK